MENFKGTKGKWHSNFNGSYWEVTNREDNKILDISIIVLNTKSRPKSIFDEAKANAQLITTAPDLLERLIKITLSMKAHPDYQTGRNQEFIDLVSLSEETINKALGK